MIKFNIIFYPFDGQSRIKGVLCMSFYSESLNHCRPFPFWNEFEPERLSLG